MGTHDQQPSLVMVVGYEGSDPARRALAAAGRILRDQEGWIEAVYVEPTAHADQATAEPAADVIDSLGPAPGDLHFEVASVLDPERHPWRWRSASGAVADELIGAARAIAEDGGPSRTVVIVVGSDRGMAFTVPTALARRSSFPVVIVP